MKPWKSFWTSMQKTKSKADTENKTYQALCRPTSYNNKQA